jgi:hypothetical protein
MSEVIETVGPPIAVLSFVCSIGNVPLAAVLWSGGISFAGVMAFLFADLIVLPIVAIYRKYYAAALAVDALFGAAGLIPETRPRPRPILDRPTLRGLGSYERGLGPRGSGPVESTAARRRREGVLMAWRISGTYLATCSCQLLCPCPTDGPPTGPNGECHGNLVFDVSEGSLDDVDLGGTKIGLINIFPSNLSAGNWTVGVVVNDDASDEQLDAIDRIMRGQEGGPFEMFAGLYGTYLGTERGEVKFSDGDTPSFSIRGNSFTFEPLPGPEGSDTQTTVKNAAFGFAPEFRVGRTSGHSDVFDIEFDAVYAESADYEFASEMSEGAATGRG